VIERDDDGDSMFRFPITSPETTMSTRRLSLRPAAVLLSATGSAFPKPSATTLLIETRTDQIVADSGGPPLRGSLIVFIAADAVGVALDDK
jgi:hypothetical protein